MMQNIQNTVQSNVQTNIQANIQVDVLTKPQSSSTDLSPLMAAIVETIPDARLIILTEVLTLPHRIRRVTTASVSWLDRTGRGLLLARPDTADVVLVSEESFDADLARWLYEQHLGPAAAQIIPIPQQLIRSNVVSTLLDHPELLATLDRRSQPSIVVPFFNSSLEIQLSHSLGADQIFGPAPSMHSMFGNKSAFKDLCQRLSLPTVPGFTVCFDNGNSNRSLANAIHDLLTQHGGVIIRGAEGTGGSSIINVTQPEAIPAAINEMNRQAGEGEAMFLVEALFPTIASPNLQWAIADHAIYYLGINDQLFSSMLAHSGNVGGVGLFADRHVEQIMEQGDRLVSALQQQGYRGVVGIDFIILDESSSPHAQNAVFPIEANTRLNGSSFTYEVLHRAFKESLDAIAWKSMKINVDVPSFAALQYRLGNLMYSLQQTLPAVIVTEFIPLATAGQIQVLLVADSPLALQELEQRLNCRLMSMVL